MTARDHGSIPATLLSVLEEKEHRERSYIFVICLKQKQCVSVWAMLELDYVIFVHFLKAHA